MTYQVPLDPAMQPQAQEQAPPPPPPPADDAARDQFIALMKGINPETDLMFGRVPRYQFGGDVRGLETLGTLGTLEEDPLGTLGNLGIPETPAVTLPAATPFPVQGKIGVPGFKGQFLKEEELRGTRFPAFAPDLRAELREVSAGGAAPAGTVPIYSGSNLWGSRPVQELGIKAAQTGIQALSPYYQKLKKGLKAGAYDILKGAEPGTPGAKLVDFLGLKPPEPSLEMDLRSRNIDYSNIDQAATTFGYEPPEPPLIDYSNVDPAATTFGYEPPKVAPSVDIAKILQPGELEVARAVLQVVAMKDVGKTNAEIWERVGGMYGTDRAVQIFNAYNKVPGGLQIPGAAVAILAGDIIGEGKITGPGARAAWTTGVGEIITGSLLNSAMLAASGTTAAGTFAAAGGTTMAGAGAGATLGAYVAGALPAIVIAGLQMKGAQKSRREAKQVAEMRRFAMPVEQMLNTITRGANNNLLVSNQEFAAIQKTVGTSDPIGILGGYAGAKQSALGSAFSKKYPKLLDVSGMSDMDDNKSNAVRALGKFATYTRIPNVGAIWDNFYHGNITYGQFKTRSQQAVAEYKNSPAYRNEINKVNKYNAATQDQRDDMDRVSIQEALKLKNPGAGVFGEGTPEAQAYRDKLGKDLAAIDVRKIERQLSQMSYVDPEDESDYTSNLREKLRIAKESTMTAEELYMADPGQWD